MLVSIAETFFIFVIGFLTAAFAFYSWTTLIPKLPFKVPPVLFCILIGCSMRLICKPLLETPSADSAFDSWSMSLESHHNHNHNHHHHLQQHDTDLTHPTISSTNISSSTTTPIPVALKSKRLLIYGEGVVKTVSNPVISFGLASVGLLIGSHIDVQFLKQHTKFLLSLTLLTALSAYSFTLLAALWMWSAGSGTSNMLPVMHLIASTAMERSSGEALATISDAKILQQGCHHSSSSLTPLSSPVFFARSTIFVAAAMDVTSVVVFVMSLGIMEKGSSVAHEAILEIVLGTSLVVIITLLTIRFQVQIEQQIVQPLLRKFSFLQNNSIVGSFYILRQQDRAAITILLTIVTANYVIPGAELLLAAASVGMKITYDGSIQQQQQQQQQQQAVRVEQFATNKDSEEVDPDQQRRNAATTPIAVIDSYSVLIMSILFSFIGLRLDASQLILTLVEHPKISITLFLGRLLGLVIGGFAGSIFGGNTANMKYRGISLITRIAVSIILLQKMEDAFSNDVAVKTLAHAAIGAVLIDMIVGPGALQWSLKRVVAEDQQQQHEDV